jgi:hypothetical protein
MMTAELFFEITNEAKGLIEDALYQLFVNYPEDYVLFLASGEYDELINRNKALNLSPYTISGHNIDNYYDFTRQHFLCEFLNTYYSFSDKQELEDDEFRMNIEFLIYAHIWEAKPFLKKNYRLANLLCGREYDWKIIIPEFGKSNFIKNKIEQPFNTVNCTLGKIISDNYKTDLRNAIAHSDYQIDIISKEIRYKSKTGLCNISFDDWSIHFAFSICLSYYFSHIVTERRKRIIQDWGKNYFTIKMPYSDGTIKHYCIQYEEYKDDFGFIYKKQLEK